jgi:heme/copper-type cytochrome/quinol oxidase subunit 2
MPFNDFMNKVRYWDNLVAKWLMRHFYFMFFQIVLVIILVFWLTNTIQVIEASFETARGSVLERLVLSESINTSIIVILLILNSFWLLYVFNGMQRISNLLKDMNFNISKLRYRDK